MRIAFLLIAVAAGCSGNASVGSSLGAAPPTAKCADASVTATEAASVASVGETADTTCESVVHSLTWAMDAAGASCTSPLDCTPVCVACPDGKHHTLVAWCNHGACAPPDDVACMVAGSPLNSCGN